VKRSELAVGDEVFVRLKYDGGAGWATVVDLDAPSPAGGRKTETVLVRFLAGGLSVAVNRMYTVSPARIYRKRQPNG